MKTEKELLLQELKDRGYSVSPNLAQKPIVPHHYKMPNGTHILVSGIGCSYFTGANQQNGDIGCVCFFYTGTKRRKRSRHIVAAEILKQTSVYSHYQDVANSFDDWHCAAAHSLSTFELIM